MYTIKYEIPVMVKRTEFDETEGQSVSIDAPTTTDIVNYLVADLNQPFDENDNCTVSTIAAEQIKDCLGIAAFRVELDNRLLILAAFKGRKTLKKIEEMRQWLTGQCSDGWGENGFDIGEFIVDVWDRRHEVKVVES